MTQQVFKMIEVKREWQALFPELSTKAINQCVLAEKKEALGDSEAAEAHVNKAIALHENGE